jgi:hypothetical protein
MKRNNLFYINIINDQLYLKLIFNFIDYKNYINIKKICKKFNLILNKKIIKYI